VGAREWCQHVREGSFGSSGVSETCAGVWVGTPTCYAASEGACVLFVAVAVWSWAALTAAVGNVGTCGPRWGQIVADCSSCVRAKHDATRALSLAPQRSVHRQPAPTACTGRLHLPPAPAACTGRLHLPPAPAACTGRLHRPQTAIRLWPHAHKGHGGHVDARESSLGVVPRGAVTRGRVERQCAAGGVGGRVSVCVVTPSSDPLQSGDTSSGI